MNYTAKISLTIAIVAIIAGGVWYARKGAPEAPPADGGTDVVVDNVGDAVVEDGMQEGQKGGVDTSDWKTYQSEEYGFEFRYPEDWGVKVDFADQQPWKTFSNTENAGDIKIRALINDYAGDDSPYGPPKDNIATIGVDAGGCTLTMNKSFVLPNNKIIGFTLYPERQVINQECENLYNGFPKERKQYPPPEFVGGGHEWIDLNDDEILTLNGIPELVKERYRAFRGTVYSFKLIK